MPIRSDEARRVALLVGAGKRCAWQRPSAALLLVLIFFSATLEVTGQRRRQRRSPRRPAIDYSTFQHKTKEHQKPCESCHKIPTSNWPNASGFPDIADYPDHDACVSCHRSQFFRGARPAICSNCHVETGPRAEARLKFRNPKTTSQFATIFPHDRHQDVIARLRPHQQIRPGLASQRAFFLRASFRSPPQDADKYNNCTICHSAMTQEFAAPRTGWIDNYVPDETTFKTAPSGHDSCFNCHWKTQEPVGSNCAGCHTMEGVEPVTPLPTRISMKFKHDGGGSGGVHVQECTSCHINITKSASARGLKPDVPISACRECHNNGGPRLDISTELAAIDKDRSFVCTYCHTSDVGKRNPPASHYLIADRPPLELRGTQ